MQARLLAALLLLPILLSPPPAGADEYATTTDVPTRVQEVASVWDGHHVYLFGGWDFATGQRVDRIARVDPALGTLEVMQARLPWPANEASAVWDPRDRPDAGCPGGCIYVLGGIGVPTSTSILHYNPATDTIRTSQATLPSARGEGSAVWTGTHAYYFGGRGPACAVRCADVVRYDPDAETSQVVAQLPAPLDGTAAAWTGTRALVAGGGWCGGASCKQVLSFDPATHAFAHLGDLPKGVRSAAAFWDGHHLFLLGGYTAAATDDVVRFDPATGAAVEMAARLPQPTSSAHAQWAGDRAHVLIETNDALRLATYSLAPAAPEDPAAAPGRSTGSVVLSWTPPPANTYSVLTHYRVYRSLDPLAQGELVAELDAGATSLLDQPPFAGPWTYRVTAVNDARDEGPASAGVTYPGVRASDAQAIVDEVIRLLLG